MDKATEERLARSLTAETAELLPFLPYLLQDFWELGSEPGVMAALAKKHSGAREGAAVLDLGCGKGAVSVRIAQALKARVKGIDLIPEFVGFAAQKARECGVADLCHFEIGDICEAAAAEKNYDVVVFGAVGSALGTPAETLRRLKQPAKPGGLILIDDACLKEGAAPEGIRFRSGEFLTEKQWAALFEESGLELAEAVWASGMESAENPDSASAMAAISKRASELAERLPGKRAIFEGYVRSQQSECDDTGSILEGVAWALRKA